jgi:hypothetical protein
MSVGSGRAAEPRSDCDLTGILLAPRRAEFSRAAPFWLTSCPVIWRKPRTCLSPHARRSLEASPLGMILQLTKLMQLTFTKNRSINP